MSVATPLEVIQVQLAAYNAKDIGALPTTAAAKLAGESTADMLTRLAQLGIAVADYDAAALADEVDTAAQWLAPSATH